MSMCHKAFALDWTGFESELRVPMEHALTYGDGTLLLGFLYVNVARVRLSDDGEPVTESWLAEHGDDDIQLIADVALTKFYDPVEDHGLQEHWANVDDRLPDAARLALLGRPVGPPENPFDPGRMGAYFQSPAMAAASVAALQEHALPELHDYRSLLRRATGSGLGVYVTF